MDRGATRVSHASNLATRMKQGLPGACRAQGARALLQDRDFCCWPGLGSWLDSFLALWPQTRDLTSLGHGSLSCEMGNVVTLTLQGC